MKKDSNTPPRARKSAGSEVGTAIPAVRHGRPRGKRSDPNYEQITAYILKETHKSVKIALLQEDRNREFSELIEELLSGWLKGRN